MATAPEYKPDPAHVQIVVPQLGAGEDSDDWHIQLSADATVVELALLMATFNCTAELITAEVLRLSPTRMDQPVPTGDQVRELFERGLTGALRNPLRYVSDKVPVRPPRPVPITLNDDPQQIVGWVDFSGPRPIIQIDPGTDLPKTYLKAIFGWCSLEILEECSSRSTGEECVRRAAILSWTLQV